MPWAAHAAAVRTRHNFQGNPRLARLSGYSLRTAQRARAWFERRGLIRSELLCPGDQLPGMNRPVRRYMIVRDVSELQQLAELGDQYVPPHRRRPRTVIDVPATADDLAGLAELAPEYSSFFHGLAAAAKRREQRKDPPSPPPPPPVNDAELDAIDRELAELERSQAPPRGPPS